MNGQARPRTGPDVHAWLPRRSCCPVPARLATIVASAWLTCWHTNEPERRAALDEKSRAPRGVDDEPPLEIVTAKVDSNNC